jgi:hypothetical protein
MVIRKVIKGIGIVPLIIIGSLLIIYFFFLPPILKYIIENQGEKQLGRKVEVGHASLNVLNGSVKIKRLAIYEPDGQKLFLSFSRLFINFNVPDLFRHIYHIEALNLDQPVIYITQHDSTFNFTDILNRFSTDTTAHTETEIPADTSKSTGPLKYLVENFSLTSGIFAYSNKDYELDDTIKNFNLKIPLVSYDQPETGLTFFFDLASGGNFKGSCQVNTNDESMVLRDTIRNFNLSKYKHYLDPYLEVGSLKGFLHTRNALKGNAANFDLKITGDLGLTDFAITDSTGEIAAACKEFSVDFDTISFSDNIMNFDSIKLIDPVLNIKLTPEGDNFSAMIPVSAPEDSLSQGESGEIAYSGSNPLEMMVAYVQESMNNYLFESYRINHILLSNGKIAYDDKTLDEPFHAIIDNLDINLANLNTAVDRSYGSLEARLNKEGHLSAEISVNPRDILDMSLKYKIRSLMVPDFNPYSVYYIAHPFPTGAFNYDGSLLISSRKIHSQNKIVIEKINLGKKVESKTATSLPIKLAIAILRDRNGDIRLNIPVEGDLDDPKLRWGRLILDILKNLIIKAATAPYDLLASAFGGSEDDYKEIRFDYMSNGPGNKERLQLDRIARILNEKPELNITFSQVVDQQKEKAAIAIFESKKMFLYEFVKLQPVPPILTSEDSLKIAALKETQDFDTFLATKLDSTLLSLSFEEKCYHLAGIEKVNSMQQAFEAARNEYLSHYFGVLLLIPTSRFTISTSTDPALIKPEYPYFKISFDANE